MEKSIIHGTSLSLLTLCWGGSGTNKASYEQCSAAWHNRPTWSCSATIFPHSSWLSSLWYFIHYTISPFGQAANTHWTVKKKLRAHIENAINSDLLRVYREHFDSNSPAVWPDNWLNMSMWATKFSHFPDSSTVHSLYFRSDRKDFF